MHREPVSTLLFASMCALLGGAIAATTQRSPIAPNWWAELPSAMVGTFFLAASFWGATRHWIVVRGPLAGLLVGTGTAILAPCAAMYVLLLVGWVDVLIHGEGPHAVANPVEGLFASSLAGLLLLIGVGPLTVPAGAIIGAVCARGYRRTSPRPPLSPTT